MCKHGPIIVVHGTSQDSASVEELTKRIADIARLAGRDVTEVSGVGSSSRSVQGTIPMHERSIEDVGTMPLDYAAKMFSGVAFGSGIRDAVGETVEAVMSKKSDCVDVVGFSRGAVASIIATNEINKYKTKLRRMGLILLDPVPGPIAVPKQLRVAECVTETTLLTSIDESRPGFRHPLISVDGGGALNCDMYRGVHGNIGGSRGGSLRRYIENLLLKRLDLPGLTTRQESMLALLAAFEQDNYAPNGSFSRGFDHVDGSQWKASGDADFVIPSTGIGDLVTSMGSAVGSLFSPVGMNWEKQETWLQFEREKYDLDRMVDKVNRSSKASYFVERLRKQRFESKETVVEIPSKPYLYNGSITFKPPTRFRLPKIAPRS